MEGKWKAEQGVSNSTACQQTLRMHKQNAGCWPAEQDMSVRLPLCMLAVTREGGREVRAHTHLTKWLSDNPLTPHL